MESPDRPANFLMRAFGFRDDEPPITDAEFERYVQYLEGLKFVPKDVPLPYCPPILKRQTRADIRRLLASPGLPRILELMATARARHDAESAQRTAEEAAARNKKEADELAQKLAEVDKFHGNQLNEVRYHLRDFESVLGSRFVDEAGLRAAMESQTQHTKNMRQMNLTKAQEGGGASSMVFGMLASAENSSRDRSQGARIAAELTRVQIRRSLVAMKPHERATLRMADVLAALGVLQPRERLIISVPIVWNDGQCDIDFNETWGTDFNMRAAMLEVMKPLVASGLGTTAGACERLNQAVRKVLDLSSGISALQRQTIERYLYSGNRWLASSETDPTTQQSPSSLSLGVFPGGTTNLHYDQRESLITVAPPGSGKTQAHVLRNLLYLNAPAVVLDVKGEMLDKTRAWREAEVGKTYAFMPQQPDNSIQYNPLDLIRDDPELAWEDARSLADLLVIPSGATGDDGYFENRARDMITTALLDISLSETGDDRSMGSVLDRLYMSEDEKVVAWCTHLESHNNDQLRRQAEALRGMPPRQREGVFDAARRQLEIWQSPAITRITRTTTFDAADLRAQNATLYLAVALEDIRKYASVLRVLIGQTLRTLYREKPESDAKTITFFLDELPRLGRMDVIEESLDVGRGYGVRLWMFCQNTGQLRIAYPNAQGMMSNCAVRAFMNPDEDSARWIAENLGIREGLLDGDRKPLVEAHQLTGPEFANQVVVFSRGAPPARLDKLPAYADPVCQKRMNTPAPDTSVRPDTAPLAVEPGATEVPGGDAKPELTAEVAQPEAAVSSAADWSSITPGEPIAPPPVTTPRQSFPPSARIGAAVALVLVFALASWIAVQAREIAALREQHSILDKEQAAAVQTLQAAQRDRDRLRTDGASAWEQLRKESEAHALTKGQLQKEQKAAAEASSQRDRLAQTLQSAERERQRVGADGASASAQLRDESSAHAQTKAKLQQETQAHASTRDRLEKEIQEHKATTAQLEWYRYQVEAARPASSAAEPSAATGPSSSVPPASRPSPTSAPQQFANAAPGPAAPSSSVTDCDRLAANPNDGQRHRDAPGVKYNDVVGNARAAIDACQRALQGAPNNPRLKYQLARSYQAAKDVAAAQPLLNELMSARYPAAFDNAGQLLQNQGRFVDAAQIYRRGIDLNDTDSMVALAGLIRDGKVAARFPGEDGQLYQRAAANNHKNAQELLAREQQAAQDAQQAVRNGLEIINQGVRLLGR